MDTRTHVIRYYLFIKWFKVVNHPDLYFRYGIFINVPNIDLLINVSIDYVAPEDKLKMINLIATYNQRSLD